MIYNVCITKAVVSPGYDKTEALKFSDSGDVVRFRIGIPHYDANAENNTYWENETVKAFGPICEQIITMISKVRSGGCNRTKRLRQKKNTKKRWTKPPT